MLKNIEKAIRVLIPKRMNNYSLYLSSLKHKNGIEIGGPSSVFSSAGFLPVYTVIDGLDGCNFSSNTVWEGSITEGYNFKYENKTGYQYIADGSALDMIPDKKYDFVLSCHSIEHIANPIKALKEWKRIIKDDGFILLVVPHKDQTFDHKRPVTSLQHLLDDFETNKAEDDNTHFEEVISLHNIAMDDGIDNVESLIKRTQDNIHNRCVHHHVFNTPLVVKLADNLSLKIIDVQHFNPFNIVILLQKHKDKPDNKHYLNPSNKIYHNPKFPSDKIW